MTDEILIFHDSCLKIMWRMSLLKIHSLCVCCLAVREATQACQSPVNLPQLLAVPMCSKFAWKFLHGLPRFFHLSFNGSSSYPAILHLHGQYLILAFHFLMDVLQHSLTLNYIFMCDYACWFQAQEHWLRLLDPMTLLINRMYKIFFRTI